HGEQHARDEEQIESGHADTNGRGLSPALPLVPLAAARPPKRRSRRAKVASARCKCRAPNSGQGVRVKTNSAYADSHSKKSDSRRSPPVRIKRSTGPAPHSK